MWTPELEVNLFHALKGHKPTGINRNFHMACIHHKMMTSCELKELTPKEIWVHLNAMYNLETLNELDELPFPNDNTDFGLPEEMTNPEFMSAPSSPATSVASADDGNVPVRPSNLNLTNIKNSSLLLSTPDSLVSPKRKRNARQAQLSSNSQPSSPATPGSLTKRRR